MMPKVTFVVPCFNQAHFLGEALGSLLRQSRPEWEAIVVDDASTAGDCRATVAAMGDDRVRILRHDVNRGLAAARNTGVRAARADLIMPLDADDRVAETFLGRVLPAFDDPKIDYVYTDVRRFGAENNVWHFGPFEPAEMGRRQALIGCSPFRLGVWRRVGGFCEDPVLRAGNEDWDFWMGVVAHGFQGVHIREPLYEYRARESSMTGTLKPTLWQTHEFIGRRYREFLEQNGVLKSFLCYGYEGSAKAAFDGGDFREAVRLAARAVELGGSDPRLRPLARLSVLPGPAVPAGVWAMVALGGLLRRLIPSSLRTRLRRLLGSTRAGLTQA